MTPEYLVQTTDGSLFAYYTLSILLIDLALHRGERVTIYKRVQGIRVSYEPTTEAALRQEAA